MKKFLLTVTILFFSLSMIYLVRGVVDKSVKNRHLNQNISSLPVFEFMTLEKEAFRSSDITEGPVLIVRFHPECDHCRYELSELFKSNIPDLVSRLILVSGARPDSLKKFLGQVDHHEHPNISVLSDFPDSFRGIFGNDVVPSNYIFNKELKLLKVIYGEVKTETLLKYIQEDE